MLPLPLRIVLSKWTYVVLAVILALACGVLIWLGGYESATVYLAGGSAIQSWSWRYETMQKAGLACGAASIILAILISIGSWLFGDDTYDENFDDQFQEYGYVGYTGY